MASLERASSAPRLRFIVALTPLLCGLACVFIANIPVSLLDGLVPSPLLALVPVYFWCLVRPDPIPCSHTTKPRSTAKIVRARSPEAHRSCEERRSPPRITV